jgi:hypothetical protein
MVTQCHCGMGLSPAKTLMAITYHDGKPLVRLYPLLTMRISF